MKKFEIAVIGTYPPPIGGVESHVERFAKHLKDNNKSFILYDTSGISKNLNMNYKCIKNRKLWLMGYLFKCSEKLIHLHERNWYFVAIICFIARIHKSKVILTLHSFREEPSEFNFIKRIMFRYSIKELHYLISAGENERNKIVKYGVDSKKIAVVPAYINPEYKSEDELLIPDYIWEYMNDGSFCICANAFRISFYNNQDLYGLDLCIELCHKIKVGFDNMKIKFIFCLPDIGDYKYYEKMKKRIEELKIEREFLIVNEKIPLYPILKKTRLFIRPTNTDSYGISIAEAIYYKVPSIASDVCRRPEGTILFKNRDIDDLYNKTIDVINDYRKYKNKLEDIVFEDNAEKIIHIYKQIINGFHK